MRLNREHMRLIGSCLVRKEAGAVVRCFRSATLSELASRTAITWPVPIAHCVALLLVRKEAGSSASRFTSAAR